MGGWARWFQHLPSGGVQSSFPEWLDMAQHTPFQMIFCGPDQTTVWVNKAFETMTGFTLAEMAGKKPGDVLQCGQTDAVVRQRVKAALDSNQTLREEILNRAKDGRLFWIDLDIEPVHDLEGNLIGYLSLQTDITVHVEQRKRLTATFNNQSIGFLVFNAEGRIIDCNDCMARLLELSVDDVTGQSLHALKGRFKRSEGPWLAENDTPLSQVFRTGQHLDMAVLGYLQPSGNEVWMTVTTEWIDPSLGAAGGCLASVIDITERRDQNIKLRAAHTTAQKNLAELQAYRSALDHHTIVSVTDAKGNIVFVNERFCDISGYTQEELLGQDHHILKSGQNPKGYFADMWNTISSGQTWRGEICNKTRDGGLFWVDGTVAPMLDGEGQINQYVAIYYDVTQRRLGERHLRESRERFKSLLAMSSDWYWESDLAHRFTLMSEGIDDTGINRLSIVGKCLWDLDVDHSDKNWALHQKTVNDKRSFSNFEFRIRNPNAPDAWLWLSISGRPTRDASGGFAGYRGVGRDVTARRQSQDKLWELANLDPLTGLPNRMRFNEALTHAVTQAQQMQHPFALAIIDLDNFKEVNDSQGHDVGDELLAAVAKRLSSVLRGNDLIARIGGDEFGVLIHGLGSGNNLTRPLDAMMNAMTEPVFVGAQMQRCSLSMGVTLYPADSTESANLIKNADIALYRAKSSGRGRYVMFHPKLKHDVDSQATLMREIEVAIVNGSLSVKYQPVVDWVKGEVVSLEALLRWQHPMRGMVSAGLFPQVFDNLGVAAQIGRLVTQMTVRQASQWLQQGVPFHKVAINVTAGDFLLGAFPAALAEQLSVNQVPSEHISVEVTEGMFLGRTAVTVMDGLQVLHQMGIEISFDDFGTGYASLMHLKLPIDRLKIDRSFVHDITANTADARTNAAIVHAVTDLGRRLGKSITVEGVETEAQLTMLTEIGCSQFQGNYFSEPLSTQDVPAFIAAFNARHAHNVSLGAQAVQV
jgi:diguanylate cyclase (GGDEF)-like protein/PAS domain S-box-containing protein